MKKLAVLVVALFMLQACLVIKPDRPTFNHAPTPPETDELATVYLHYDANPGSRIAFYVDGKHYFDAYWGTYSWVQTTPGQHTFKAQVNFWDMDLGAWATGSTANQPVSTEILLEAGKTYYLELTETGTSAGTAVTYVAPGVVTVSELYKETGKRLEPVYEARALEKLRRSIYIEPRVDPQIR